MTTQYTPILQLALPVTGELNGTWGDVVNDNITSMVEEAIAGLATISTWTTNAHTLTTADGVTDEARCAMLVLQTGSGGTALGGAGQVICPARTKLYVVKNDAAYAVTVKTSGGSGVAIAAGDTAFVFCDGTNVNACVTQIINGHITGNLTVDGNTTLGDASGDAVTINAGTTTVKTGGAIRFEDNAGGEYVALKAPAAVTTYTLTLPIDDGTNGQALITDGSGNLSWSTAASGDVYGPASATDTAVALFDGTTGKLIKNSGVTIDGSNNVSGVAQLNATTVDLTNLEVTNIKAKDGTAAITLADSTGVATLSANPILNAGTANGVAYLNGSKVLTTGSALTFDGTDFVLASGGLLDIDSTNAAVAMRIRQTTAGTGTEFNTTITENTGVTFDSSDSGGATARSFLWTTAGTEQMRLTSTGLGIGTSSPSARATIKAAGNGYSNGALALVGATTGTSYITSSNGLLYFSNDGSTDQLILNASGNLGLGVTPSAWYSPYKAIQVQGSQGGVLNIASGQTFITSNGYYNGTNYVYQNSNYAGVFDFNGASSGGYAWRLATSGTAGNAISFTQAMTLNASGNLGIGTSSPNYLLSVQANSVQMGMSPQSGIGYLGNYSNAPIGFVVNNSEKMRLDTSGNVIIGASTAYEILNVWGSATIVNASYRSSGQGNYLTFRTGGDAGERANPVAAIRGIDQYTAPGATGYSGSLLFYYQTNNTLAEGARLNYVGNFGIGTNSPAEKLDVTGTIRSNSANYFFRGYTANGATELAYLWSDATSLQLSAKTAIPLLFLTSNTERMRLDASGNLGLGVTPSAWSGYGGVIELKGIGYVGSANTNMQLGANFYYNGTNSIYKTTAAASIYQQNAGAHYWFIAPSGTAGAAITFTQAMTLDASGNLAIGTTVTTGKRATVYDDNYPYIYFQNQFTGTTSATGFRVGYESNIGAYVDNRANTPMIFQTNATERMRLDSSGNLLIGTTTNTNSSKLVVNGTISETVGGTQYLVLSQADIGTAPNEVPVNGMLGKLAFEDVVDTVTNNPYNDTAISDVQPSLLLDFANSKVLDPRVTFTRSTTATYYNGVTTAVAEQNLFTYSQNFTQWSQTGASATANTVTAPDGTTTGNTFTTTVTGTPEYFAQTPTAVAGQPYVISLYAKANTISFIQVVTGSTLVSSGYANFNITAGAGAVGNYGGSLTPTIVDAGNGWYRCIITIPSANTGSGVIEIHAVDSATAARSAVYTGSIGNSFYIWGAQFEQRSAVSSYTPTTSAAITNYIPVMQTALAGVPRFDCNPTTGESLGLLIEEQRTNLFTYSSQFDNAAWSKSNSTVDANAIVAPDGTLTGDKIIATATTGDHYAYVSAVSVTGPYTLSVCAKAGESSFLAVYTGGNWTWFNLAAGVLGTVATNQTGNIQAIGNGWYRCSVSVPSGSYSFHAIGVATSNGASSSTGNGYSGLYIWGAQLEAGSFATSYIATTSSSATRNADAASMTGTNFSSWFSMAEGSFYCEASTVSTTSVRPVVLVGDGTNNNRIYTGYAATTNAGTTVVTNNGVSQVAISGASTTINTNNKFGLAYAPNNFSAELNGVVSGTSTSGSLPAVNRLYVGINGDSSAYLNGTIKKLAYYPKRLSDAELQEMTE